MSIFDFLFGTARYHSSTVITDVTRMRDGRVCIAALRGTRQIRLANPQPTERWLDAIGGLTPGAVVKVDWHSSLVHSRPHVEDGNWIPASFRKLRQDRIPRLEDRLQDRKTVRQAFGEPLYLARRGNPAFSPNTGTRSLATVQAARVRVYRSGERIRADFDDGDRAWRMIPVEDLRLWRHARSCDACRGSAFAESLEREMSGEGILLRIGLGRPFRPDSIRPEGCYLQLNSIVWPSDAPKHLFAEPTPATTTV